MSDEVSQASLDGQEDHLALHPSPSHSPCDCQSPTPTSLELEFQVHECEPGISNLIIPQWGHLDDKAGSSLKKAHIHGSRSHVDFIVDLTVEAKERLLACPTVYSLNPPASFFCSLQGLP